MPVGDDAPIPLPGQLAPCSFLNQFTSNPLFTGRDAELRSLARALRAQHGAVAITTGIGGVGKTQLAIEFAHRYGPYFAGGVFWVNCERAEAVSSAITTCGSFGLVDWRPDYGQLKADEQLALVGQAWRSPLPRLLIFDNCEDDEVLQTWRPSVGGCRVLVTSRRANWSAALALAQQPLRELGQDDGAGLLLRYRADLGAEAGEIAAALGGLPLALHLAGSYLRRYRMTAKSYLAQLGSALVGHESLQGRAAEASPTGHTLHIAQTFALSYDQLRPEVPTDASARALLARAAYLAPGEPIPHDLLLATLGLDEADVAKLMQAEDGLHRLLDTGLLERANEQSYRLHRLIADFVTTEAEMAAVRTTIEQGILAKSELTEVMNSELLPTMWLPHLRYMVAQAAAREDELALRLGNTLGVALHRQGYYAEARPFFERIRAIRERVLGAEHPATATSLNNLAALYQSQGHYDDARPLYERALALRERVLGAEHPDTASSLNNLAGLYQAQGRYNEARPLYERALTIYENLFGSLHPDAFKPLNNLAGLHLAQGRLLQARQYFTRALAVSKHNPSVTRVVQKQIEQQLGKLGGPIKSAPKSNKKGKKS